MKSRGLLGLLAAGVILTVVGTYLVWRSFPGKPAPAGAIQRVFEVKAPIVLPPFRLQGTHGEFSNDGLSGRWTFLFFGYTQCPDICPTALALMKQVRKLLDTKSPGLAAQPVQVVFVSVDPKRDTRELLGQYLGAFDPSFIGASGDDAALGPLTSSLGIRYQRNDVTDKKNYTVDHSANILLIDPQGRHIADFPPPQEAALMVAELRRHAAR